MSDERILESLAETMELPSFPAVVTRLQQVLDGPDPTVQEAAAVVLEDPGIAGRVVKLAASTLYNPMGAAVESIEQAVMRVGLRELRNLTLAVGVSAACSGIAERKFTSRVWKHSLTAGLAAGLLVEYCRDLPPLPPRSNPYFLAGMTHDIGSLLVARVLGERHQAVLEESLASGTPMHELERRELGFCHAEAGAAVISSWGLPDSIAAIARYHHDPGACPEEHRTNVTLIHVAEWLAEHQGYGWNEVGATLCDDGWEQLGMSLDDVAQLIEAFDQAASDSEQLLSVLDA